MPTTKLGDLLQNAGLPFEVDDQAAALLERVSVGDHTVKHAIGPYQAKLPVVGKSLDLKATLDLEARFSPTGAFDDPFGAGLSVEPPTGGALARLAVAGQLSGSGGGAATSGAWKLSASASGTGAFHYTHQRRVAPGRTRLEALTRLVARSRLPGQLDLQRLEEGESHELGLLLDLQIAVQATAGWQQDVAETVGLFDGLSADLRARVDASFKAALGVSLFEDMRLAVGRVNLSEGHPSWIRLRVRRESERRLTLGATVSVLVDYDASSLGVVLQRALDESPLTRLVEALRKVTELPATGEGLSTLVADELSAKLGDRASATLQELLQGSEEVDALVRFADQVVSTWDGLDDRLTSWWEQVLGGVDLGADSKLRSGLAELAAIDPKKFKIDDLVAGSRLKEVVSLVELFGGASWEELVLAGEERAKEVIGEAVGLARRADGLLTGLPADVKGRIDGFVERTRVATAIDLLSRVSSKEQLETTVDEWSRARVRLLVQRLVGAVRWEEVSENLTQVQSWAQGLLDRWSNLEGRLARATKRLKGQVGFSLGLEIERVTRRLAVVDIELDPEDGALRGLAEQVLRKGDVKALLAGLPPLEPDQTQQRYLLREALLSSRRVRSSAVSLLFSWAGLQKTVGRRVEELAIRVRQEGGTLHREADYGGGFFLSYGKSGRSYAGAAWLELRGRDQPQRPLDAYPNGLEPSLLLKLSREEVPLDQEERVAIESLLRQLGFSAVGAGAGGALLPAIPDGAVGRFALALRVGAAGVRAVFADGGGSAWDRDYLRAAYRWYSDGFLDLPLGARERPRRGEAMAAIVRFPHFQEHWKQGVGRLSEALWADPLYRDQTLPGTDVRIGERCVTSNPAGHPGGGMVASWFPDLNPLYFLALKRSQEATRWSRIGGALPVRRHQDAVRTTRDAAQAFRGSFPALSITQDSNWPSPSFLLWLVLARLAGPGDALLGEVRGHASLRWKPAGDEEWGEPRVFRVTAGVPPSAVRAMREAIP